jgi:hypothetical protein
MSPYRRPRKLCGFPISNELAVLMVAADISTLRSDKAGDVLAIRGIFDYFDEQPRRYALPNIGATLRRQFSK